jgi:hypothetical protein
MKDYIGRNVFIPAIYSKCQLKADFLKRLAEAPKQKDNSKEAFAGKVFEVCEQPGGPVATLAEIFEVDKLSEIIIKTKDGALTVVRDAEGNWKAKE